MLLFSTSALTEIGKPITKLAQARHIKGMSQENFQNQGKYKL
jgi:hypothetical protein